MSHEESSLILNKFIASFPWAPYTTSFIPSITMLKILKQSGCFALAAIAYGVYLQAPLLADDPPLEGEFLPPEFVNAIVEHAVPNQGTFEMTAAPEGTYPMLFEWFHGTVGDTSNPIDNLNASFQVNEDTLTVHEVGQPLSLWVRANNLEGSDSQQIYVRVYESDEFIDSFEGDITIQSDGFFSTGVGVFHPKNYPWCFHEDLNWVWFVGSPDDLWIYSPLLDTWLWTTETLYPHVYLLAQEKWSYLYSAGGSSIFFYDYNFEEFTEVR